jgi:hypothetical protein
MRDPAADPKRRDAMAIASCTLPALETKPDRAAYRGADTWEFKARCGICGANEPSLRRRLE